MSKKMVNFVRIFVEYEFLKPVREKLKKLD